MQFAPLALAAALLTTNAAYAQSTEEKFQDLFVTAGYCTAFGAAVGTAILAWTEDPTANLRYVAMGASLGFLGGSVLGSYIIFSPGLTDNSRQATTSSLAQIPSRGVMIRPIYNLVTKQISSLEAGMTLVNF